MTPPRLDCTSGLPASVIHTFESEVMPWPRFVHALAHHRWRVSDLTHLAHILLAAQLKSVDFKELQEALAKNPKILGQFRCDLLTHMAPLIKGHRT